MILTNCAACAAPLAHNAPRCVRCWTRYCVYRDPAATLDDLREAVTTLEELDRTARRVLGGTHPTTVRNERSLRNARAILSVRANAPTCVAIFAAAALALAAAYLARKKLT